MTKTLTICPDSLSQGFDIVELYSDPDRPHPVETILGSARSFEDARLWVLSKAAATDTTYAKPVSLVADHMDPAVPYKLGRYVGSDRLVIVTPVAAPLHGVAALWNQMEEFASWVWPLVEVDGRDGWQVKARRILDQTAERAMGHIVDEIGLPSSADRELLDMIEGWQR